MYKRKINGVSRLFSQKNLHLLKCCKTKQYICDDAAASKG